MSCVKDPPAATATTTTTSRASLLSPPSAVNKQPHSLMSSTHSPGRAGDLSPILRGHTGLCTSPQTWGGSLECLVNDSGSWKRSESFYNQIQLRTSARRSLSESLQEEERGGVGGRGRARERGRKRERGGEVSFFPPLTLF